MKVGIIGIGNMGSAMASQMQEHELVLCSRSQEKADKAAKKYGGVGVTHVEKVADCDVIIIAVKPKDFEHVASQLASKIADRCILVSVVAGVTKELFASAFPTGIRVRTMPNLAVAVGEGIIGVDETGHAEETKATLETLFAPFGQVRFVSEKLLDGLVVLSGGVPAFFCLFLEGIIEAGILLGFKAADAKEIGQQAVLGTMAMMEKQGLSTQEYRWKNCSPAGTTIQGIAYLEEHGMIGTIMEACRASYDHL